MKKGATHTVVNLLVTITWYNYNCRSEGIEYELEIVGLALGGKKEPHTRQILARPEDRSLRKKI